MTRLDRLPLEQPAQLALRLGLGTAYLSAVADRLGLWGPPGTAGVAWGDFQHFTAYSSSLTWFMPAALAPLLAVIATALEAIFGVLLLVGLRTREVAFGSAVLLASFAFGMTGAAGGIHSVFTYSVLTGAGGSLLLASVRRPAWSLDALAARRESAPVARSS